MDHIIFVLRRTWRIARWVVLGLALAYAAIVVYAYPHDHAAHLDEAAVAKIARQRLTTADADGSHLPPPPDPSQAGATVAGVDANQNGIRDDVELAIFAEYPTSSASSTPVRAAELQYAKALQLEFTDVSDSATLVAVMRQEGRGFMCVPTELETDHVEQLVFNTAQRKAYREDLYRKYMTSFGLDSSDFCDLTF